LFVIAFFEINYFLKKKSLLKILRPFVIVFKNNLKIAKNNSFLKNRIQIASEDGKSLLMAKSIVILTLPELGDGELG
jgi:hypothetical protein